MTAADINKFLELIGLGPTELLYTTTAVIIGMTYTMVPYAVLAMYSVFVNFDLNLVTAARSIRLRCSLSRRRSR